MKFLGRGLLVATTTLLLTALGFAQGNAAEYDQYGNKIPQPADRGQYSNGVFPTANPQFMKDAAQDAMAKIHLAYLALQNAQHDQVRAFAQQILNDYGKTQADLFNIANQQAVVLPNTLDAKNLDTFQALSELQGKAFDQAYMKAMLNQDETALSSFKQEATKGDGWASQALPRLESDLKTAQKLAPVVGVHSAVTSQGQRAPSAGKPTNAASQKQ
jgi:putative membrane protein